MQIVVHGEIPFKCLKNTFSVAATSSGFTLNYSVDKVTWTAWTEPTPANEVLVVNGITPYTWFKLAGNVDEDVAVIV